MAQKKASSTGTCTPSFIKHTAAHLPSHPHSYSQPDTPHSRLYSEKAYVLSRGFVRRALEIPLGGLERELHWFYYTNGKLKKVLDDARALIAKSQKGEEETEADR